MKCSQAEHVVLESKWYTELMHMSVVLCGKLLGEVYFKDEGINIYVLLYDCSNGIRSERSRKTKNWKKHRKL
jgi:hypothetical protein